MQILVAFGLACATVIIHGAGTAAAIVHLGRAWQARKGQPGLWTAGLMIVRVVGALLLLHLIETTVWAGFYVVLGLLPDLETALYFSIASYTTVGYGDVVLTTSWRLLGPIESAVGILMFGWSTGIMVAAVGRIYGERLRWRMDHDQSG